MILVDANVLVHASVDSFAQHGLILCSTEGDFGRFSGVRWENPLGPAE